MLYSSEYKCNTFIVSRKFSPLTHTYLGHNFLVFYTRLLLVFPAIVPPILLFGNSGVLVSNKFKTFLRPFGWIYVVNELLELTRNTTQKVSKPLFSHYYVHT